MKHLVPEPANLAKDVRDEAAAVVGDRRGVFADAHAAASLVDHPEAEDGCCYHEITNDDVIDNKPVPAFRETEDATKSDTYVLVSRQRMLGSKWTTTTTKRVPPE